MTNEISPTVSNKRESYVMKQKTIHVFLPLPFLSARPQVECNPNIFPDPFKAQVFIRIWDDKVEVSSQAMLTKLTDAIKQHMAALKVQG